MKDDIDFDRAVEIAEGIYWVGQYIENDLFQCHAYYIENGDESILIDPGSMLNYQCLLRKIDELQALHKIKYIILHHQDPDLAAAVPILERKLGRDDLKIITHSRMTALIKHYLIQSEYYEIDRHNFCLNTSSGLTLRFITTPYCHSPGAFVTYDAKTKVLFSSDIFGGLEDTWQFFADQQYFQYAKAFHAEYMPGKDIFNYSLNKIADLDLELIAPQHGSLIPRQYISGLIHELRHLDCGLYIDPKYNQELLDVIQQLERKDVILREQHHQLQRHKNVLDYRAHHDDLTGLPNRVLFLDRLQQSILYAKRHHSLVAVLFFDLDCFKLINESFGHYIGDQVLAAVGQRLKNHLRAVDSVARTGGDEFAVMINSLHKVPEIVAIVEILLDRIKQKLVLQGHELYVSSSIGISLFPTDGIKAEILIRNADAAMHKAKDEGRDNYQFYTRKMTDQAVERLLMEREIRHAIERQEFTLFYQPQVEIQSSKIIGVEALVRWRHETLGLIPPSQFIPLSEENGLIIPLGEQILEMACRQMANWKCQNEVDFRLAVNLSAKQLRDETVVDRIAQILKANHCLPEWIELEVTESYVMTKPEQAIAILQRLQNLGIRISIDDFGTGYSSLAYLKRLPVNTLKIDRSFVRDIDVSEDDRAIVLSIISLARNMNLDVIAEGVETSQQKRFLQQKGCQTIQGFIHGHPLVAEEMGPLLASEPIASYG